MKGRQQRSSKCRMTEESSHRYSSGGTQDPPSVLLEGVESSSKMGGGRQQHGTSESCICHSANEVRIDVREALLSDRPDAIASAVACQNFQSFICVQAPTKI